MEHFDISQIILMSRFGVGVPECVEIFEKSQATKSKNPLTTHCHHAMATGDFFQIALRFM